MDDIFKIAICQLKVTNDKHANTVKAVDMIKRAKENKAAIVVLPEMFNCPYDNSLFSQFAESEEDGDTLAIISKIAKELGVYIVAGSIPERSEDKIYNTSFIFDGEGKRIGKHRKMHLFDIDVPGKIQFKESEVLSLGNNITVLDTEMCKIGVAICYDMRFPELFRMMTLKGAKLIIIPAAFNMVTGPAHWEPLIRMRALDNQVYVVAASPARDEMASYIAYGNSMVADPWGNIICATDEKEGILYADIDLTIVDKIREELPVLKHRRTDIYDVIEK